MSSIKEGRLKCGLTQRELAKEIKVDHTIISKWEKYNKLPKAYEYLVRLDCIFNDNTHPVLEFLEECANEGIIDVDTQIRLTFEYFRV